MFYLNNIVRINRNTCTLYFYEYDNRFRNNRASVLNLRINKAIIIYAIFNVRMFHQEDTNFEKKLSVTK